MSTPITTSTAGGTGGKADQIQVAAKRDAWGFRAGAVACALVGVAALLWLPGLAGPVMAVALTVAAPVLWRRAPAGQVAAGKASRGNVAEAEILLAIQGVPDGVVAWIEQGRQLAPSKTAKEDTDFVVGMQSGAIVIVESKNALGRLTVVEEVLYSASRAIHHGELTSLGGSPMAQACRGAGYVQAALAGGKVGVLAVPTPVVCAHKGQLRAPLTTAGEYPAIICNISMLPGVLVDLAGQAPTVAPGDVGKARKAIRRAHKKRS